MMRKIIAFVCFAIFLFSRAQALSWHAVNVDYTTAAAMSAAYATEALEESNTATHISKILEHYKTAGIASAGIFLSKKKERERPAGIQACLPRRKITITIEYSDW